MENIIASVIIVLAVGWIGLLVVGVWQTFTVQRSSARVRLERLFNVLPIEKEKEQEPFPEVGAAIEGGQQQLQQLQQRQHRQRRRRESLLPTISRLLSHSPIMNRLELELNKAHLNLRASELVTICVFLAVIALLVTFWLTKGAQLPSPLPALLATGVSLVALCFPFWYLRFLQARHRRAFERYLPETLTMMSNGLRSGLSFLQTVEMVAREGNPPISEEFSRLHQQVEMGVPVEQALNDFATRMNTPEAELLVAAVLVQREAGGRLTDVMELISNTIRERVRIKGEIRTITAMGRLSAIILTFLPFGVALAANFIRAALAPDLPAAERFWLAPMFASSLGKTMLIGAIIWQLIGIAIVYRIINIEV